MKVGTRPLRGMTGRSGTGLAWIIMQRVPATWSLVSPEKAVCVIWAASVLARSWAAGPGMRRRTFCIRQPGLKPPGPASV